MLLSPPAPDLPVLNGVGPSRVVLPSGNWLTILDFLSERFPHVDKLQWQARMLERKVLKHDGSAVHPEEPYQPHQPIFYYRHVDTELALPFSVKVLFEDEHLVVADKPHFMPVTPGGRHLQNSVLVQLKHATGCPRCHLFTDWTEKPQVWCCCANKLAIALRTTRCFASIECINRMKRWRVIARN